MMQYGSNLSIDAWVTRLGRVLAEDTGSQPGIRRLPFEEDEARADLLWWVTDPAALFIGVSEADAEILRRIREKALPGKSPNAASLGFCDLLNRSLGPCEIASQTPGDSAHRELYRVEFATGESVHLVVARTEPVLQDTSNLDMLMDIELPITLRFGSTRMALRDIAGLGSGSVIEFDRGVDEPVEVLVNGHVVARGDAVMVKGSYGVRISEISSRRERLLSSSVFAAKDSREPAGEQIR